MNLEPIVKYFKGTNIIKSIRKLDEDGNLITKVFDKDRNLVKELQYKNVDGTFRLSQFDDIKKNTRIENVVSDTNPLSFVSTYKKGKFGDNKALSTFTTYDSEGFYSKNWYDDRGIKKARVEKRADGAYSKATRRELLSDKIEVISFEEPEFPIKGVHDKPIKTDVKTQIDDHKKNIDKDLKESNKNLNEQRKTFESANEELKNRPKPNDYRQQHDRTKTTPEVEDRLKRMDKQRQHNQRKNRRPKDRVDQLKDGTRTITFNKDGSARHVKMEYKDGTTTYNHYKDGKIVRQAGYSKAGSEFNDIIDDKSYTTKFDSKQRLKADAITSDGNIEKAHTYYKNGKVKSEYTYDSKRNSHINEYYDKDGNTVFTSTESDKKRMTNDQRKKKYTYHDKTKPAEESPKIKTENEPPKPETKTQDNESPKTKEKPPKTKTENEPPNPPPPKDPPVNNTESPEPPKRKLEKESIVFRDGSPNQIKKTYSDNTSELIAYDPKKLSESTKTQLQSNYSNMEKDVFDSIERFNDGLANKKFTSDNIYDEFMDVNMKWDKFVGNTAVMKDINPDYDFLFDNEAFTSYSNYMDHLQSLTSKKQLLRETGDMSPYEVKSEPTVNQQQTNQNTNTNNNQNTTGPENPDADIDFDPLDTDPAEDIHDKNVNGRKDKLDNIDYDILDRKNTEAFNNGEIDAATLEERLNSSYANRSNSEHFTDAYHNRDKYDISEVDELRNSYLTKDGKVRVIKDENKDWFVSYDEKGRAQTLTDMSDTKNVMDFVNSKDVTDEMRNTLDNTNFNLKKNMTAKEWAAAELDHDKYGFTRNADIQQSHINVVQREIDELKMKENANPVTPKTELEDAIKDLKNEKNKKLQENDVYKKYKEKIDNLEENRPKKPKKPSSEKRRRDPNADKWYQEDLEEYKRKQKEIDEKIKVSERHIQDVRDEIEKDPDILKKQEEVVKKRKEAKDWKDNGSAKKDKEAKEKLQKEIAKKETEKAGLEYRKKLGDNQFSQKRLDHNAEKQKIVDDFKKKVEGAPKDSKVYKEAQKEMQSEMKKLYKESEYARTVIDPAKKDFINKSEFAKGKLGPMQLLNAGFSIYGGIQEYKKQRSEGKSVISSAVHGLANVAYYETVGILGDLAIKAATGAPKAIAKGASMLYQQNRAMNSSANFVVFGGSSFQDNQELATMRQSGMELAKMSRYNLEQTLMGTEAKHLHR